MLRWRGSFFAEDKRGIDKYYGLWYGTICSGKVLQCDLYRCEWSSADGDANAPPPLSSHSGGPAVTPLNILWLAKFWKGYWRTSENIYEWKTLSSSHHLKLNSHSLYLLVTLAPQYVGSKCKRTGALGAKEIKYSESQRRPQRGRLQEVFKRTNKARQDGTRQSKTLIWYELLEHL